jgi:hypothetical protein
MPLKRNNQFINITRERIYVKKSLTALFTLLLLAGCGEQASIENAIRENLKDPESTTFKNFVVGKKGKWACVEWNSKNSFGGYGEWDIARLKKTDGEWKVLEMRVPDQLMHYCTQKGADGIEETEEAVNRILGRD